MTTQDLIENAQAIEAYDPNWAERLARIAERAERRVKRDIVPDVWEVMTRNA